MYASFESDVIVHRIKNSFKDALKQMFQNITPYIQIQGGIVQYQVKAQHRYGETAACGAKHSRKIKSDRVNLKSFQIYTFLPV